MQSYVNLARKRMAKIPLSQECKSIILGSILGDGSLKLTSGYANARLTIKHTTPQRDYMEWIVFKLGEIAAPLSYAQREPSGFSKHKKLVFQSAAKPQLTDIWNLIGKNNLTIRRSWLNHMNELSLAVWWFDDGSITGDYRKGVICTDNFHIKFCHLLAQYLEVVWDIKCKVSRKNEKSTRENLDYRLFLGNKALRKLLNYILPYAVTPFMVKKCLLIYRNINFQQRWISQMKNCLPEESIAILRQILKEHTKINFEKLNFDKIESGNFLGLNEQDLAGDLLEDFDVVT